MATPLENAVSLFERQFGRPPAVAARAPGRVEVIGNHTDYNGGLVLGAGIDREIASAGTLRDDRVIRLVSGGGNEVVVETHLDALDRRTGPDRWINYPVGVIVMLQRAGMEIDRGMDIAFDSNVPTGAGLSSSAALELATAELVLQFIGASMDPADLVRLCRRAENQFVGVPSGILDQGSSKFSEVNALVAIDCRVESFQAVPLPGELHLWVFNSHVKHALVTSLYEARHRECMEALEILRQRHPSFEYLTDATADDVQAAADALEPVRFRRALHVTTEHARVAEALRSLEAGDAGRLGALMFASHDSSRTLFENSTPELDAMVHALRDTPHVLGARLTGGGFGGAVLALTDPAFDQTAAERVAGLYAEQFGSEPSVFHCTTAAGAGPATVPS